MSHPPVVVLGASEAAMLLRNPGDVRVSAVIAVCGQRDAPVSIEGVAATLVLRFDDTEAPDPGDPLSAARLGLRRREAADVGLELTPPTPDEARRIVDFARSIRNMDGTLLCQCQAGVSRSAAALLCLAAWTEPGEEEACVRELLAVRPCAAPHRDLVRFGDAMLGREGALVAATDRILA